MMNDRYRDRDRQRFEPFSRHVVRNRYRGYGRPAEREHDRGMNRIYGRIRREIERDGGRIVEARTEADLKREVGREVAIRSQGQKLGEQELRQIAEDLGLTVVHREIKIPDLQLRVERKHGDQYISNVEFASKHYSRTQIRQKIAAGFSVHMGGMGGRKVRSGPDIVGALLSR
jgi:signal recognition particle subunit SEC65